ncbi:MAG: organomercurial lyase [Planctomycetota bacterium]|nr:organomercurial lyase [Planctomycetota bacterium]
MIDGDLHTHLIRAIITNGRAPGLDNLAAHFDQPTAEVQSALHRLHDGHGLVLHPGTTEVWAIHPFSLVPTGTWVENDTRGWWAPCLWCGLGIASLVGPDVRLHARIGGESEPLVIERTDAGVTPPDLVIHFPVTIAHAWDNVHRFCGCVQPFHREGEVDAWCARHSQPRGDVRPIAQLDALARHWYGGYADEGWHKWTVDEARAIFERHGLDGPTWELPVADGHF